MKRLKLFLKWTFIFGILSLWSYMVIGSITGNVIKEESNIYIQQPIEIQDIELNSLLIEEKQFNVPIYSLSSIGIEKANSEKIIEILFYYNFNIERRKEIIQENTCSLRGDDGILKIEGKEYNNSKFNFYLNNNVGEGSLISQDQKDRVSMDITPNKIIKTDLEELIVNCTGEITFNKNSSKIESMELTIKKNERIVKINGGEIQKFEVDILITFSEGCFSEEKEFYLITDLGRLENKRSIEEVRQILDAHPELADMYEGLNRLNNDYWWLILTPEFVS